MLFLFSIAQSRREDGYKSLKYSVKCSSSQNVRTHLDQAQLVCSRAVSVAALVSERATLGSEVRVLSVAWEFCLPCVTWFSSFCSLDKEWIDFSSDQRLWFAFDGFFHGRVYLCICPSVYIYFLAMLCGMWKHRVLTIGLPGNSQGRILENVKADRNVVGEPDSIGWEDSSGFTGGVMSPPLVGPGPRSLCEAQFSGSRSWYTEVESCKLQNDSSCKALVLRMNRAETVSEQLVEQDCFVSWVLVCGFPAA